MKMTNAGTASISAYKLHSRNCNLNRCQRPYLAAVPSLSAVQLFVNFGVNKPASVQFSLVDLCTHQSPVTITTSCFKIAFNGSYWYGIFKGFESSSTFSVFLIGLNVIYLNTETATFFSEQYTIENACDSLVKLNVCYPYNFNAEDPNGIYIGQHDAAYSFSGKEDLFYQHSYWVRDSELIETQNKITFTANSSKNFASVFNKTQELRYELVPGWYKSYLAAVFFRGNFFIDNDEVKATELAFENVLEDADLWKAYVKLDKEFKGSFGCATIECPVDECVCIPVSAPAFILPVAIENQPYNFSVNLLGSQVIIIASSTKPAWMTINLTGNTLSFTGTPATGDISGSVSVTIDLVNDCGSLVINKVFSVIEHVCVPVSLLLPVVPDPVSGELYLALIALGGTPPFILSAIVKPAWMTISLTIHNAVSLTGLPPATAEDVAISFTVSNDCGSVNFATTVDVVAPSIGNFEIENETISGVINSVNPTFYLEIIGGFPVNGGDIYSGVQGGYSGAINVNVSGVTTGNQLKLLRNGVEVDSVNCSTTGTYTLNAASSIIFTSSDYMKIKLV